MAKSPSSTSGVADQGDSAAALAATAPAAQAPAGAAGVVKLAVLENGVCREWDGDDAMVELPKELGRRQARLWIDVCGADHELKARVAAILKLHPLLVEDIAERDQLAKLEQVGDLLHRDVQRRLYRQLRHGLPAEGEKRLLPPQLLN